MKKLITLTCIASTFLLIGAAFGFGQKDFETEKRRLLQESSSAKQEALLYSCKQIGDLTARCYKDHDDSCNAMKAAEDEHTHFFGTDAYDDCVKPTIAPAAQGTDAPAFDDCPEGQMLLDKGEYRECGPIQNHETEVSTPEGGPPAVDPLFRGDEESN